MPRNGYTKIVRSRDRKQIDRQVKGLAVVAANLRCHEGRPLDLSPVDTMKERRNVRLEQKRRDKAKRRAGSSALDSARGNEIPTEPGRGER